MASTIGGCLDILNLLGDHVNNKKLLYNLCLVSRHFNHIFSKRLWRRLEFDDLNKHCFADDERRGIILQSPSLQHTRILIYNIHKVSSKSYLCTDRIFQERVAELAELVQKLPNLESIVAHELDVSDDIMLALSNTTFLKSLVLHFAIRIESLLSRRDNPDQDEYGLAAAPWHGRPCCILPPFENLKRLTLVNIFGELRYWLEWILGLLCRSPALEHLSFSIASSTRTAIWTEMRESAASLPYHTFFSDLCNKYGHQSSKQLKLRTLHLKEPIRFPNLPTLSKLTDTTYLEDIYVGGRSEKVNPMLDVLSPKATPSLRRLTMEYANHTVVKMLWELSSITDRRLSILSIERSRYDADFFLYYPSLVAESAPSISFLYWPLTSEESFRPRTNGSKNVGVYIGRRIYGRTDTELSRDLSDVFRRLDSMESLEELWLEARSFSEMESHASTTPEEACGFQIVLSYLAAACRRLHYVKIGKLTWRIHPKVRHTKQQVCTFEEIDAWEAAAEGPAAFLSPNPFHHSVLREDWW
ncbi:hypothetical protein G3M48_009529 [Beauveria asiatica]|uniref:F-box domain-containing protein n=1 Tax=Beauveria asiatica TaxID=1069075 RepID=A0AAW0RII4_9HYPO